MEAKLKHLEMIQAIIARMAGNSFLLRGWSVTLAAGLFALAAKDANGRMVAIAYFPVLVFWLLDGFFLAQERRYRALYDKVRKLAPNEVDFSMDTRELSAGRNTWLAALLSVTELLFYGSVLVALVLVSCFLLR